MKRIMILITNVALLSILLVLFVYAGTVKAASIRNLNVQINLATVPQLHQDKHQAIITQFSLYKDLSDPEPVWTEVYNGSNLNCQLIKFDKDFTLNQQIGRCKTIPLEVEQMFINKQPNGYLITDVYDIKNTLIFTNTIQLETIHNTEVVVRPKLEPSVLGVENKGDNDLVDLYTGKSNESIVQNSDYNPNLRTFNNTNLFSTNSKESYNVLSGQSSDTSSDFSDKEEIDDRVSNLAISDSYENPAENVENSKSKSENQVQEDDHEDNQDQNQDLDQEQVTNPVAGSSPSELPKTEEKHDDETQDQSRSVDERMPYEYTEPMNPSEILQTPNWVMQIDSIKIKDVAQFDGQIRLYGQVIYNEDTVGQAKFMEGASEINIQFSNEYVFPPIVTATLASNSNVNKYYIDKVTTKGFTIYIEPVASDLTIINWHAFASDRGKLTIASSFTDPLGNANCKGYVWIRGFKTSHKGVDLALRSGCTIQSIGKGKVTFAGWLDDRSGNSVIIDHKNGFKSYYIHGSGVFYVQEGQDIEAGQKIMEMGNTGESKGTHLHLGLKKDDVWVDPATFIPYNKL